MPKEDKLLPLLEGSRNSSSAQLVILSGDTAITKVEKTVLTVNDKARIKISRVDPALHGGRLVSDSPALIKKREHASRLGVTVPYWGNAPIYAPKDRLLSDVHREKLINYPGTIWFRNASIDDKNDFLNAVEMALVGATSHNKNYPIDLTPAEQKEKLLTVAATLEKAKNELGLLSGTPLNHAENTHCFMNVEYQLSFHEVPSVFLMNDDCDGDFKAMLAHTWMYLHDTIKTLESASKRIKPSKRNQPSIHVNDYFIERLARTWKYLSGKYPPISKGCSFHLFLQALGELINQTFTEAEMKRAITKVKSED